MFIHFVLQVFIFWFMIYLINYLLSRFQITKRRYANLLHSLGCHVSIFTINFYTKFFNHFFSRISRKNPRLWKIWFTIGIFIAFITAICACLVLIFLPLKYIYELQQTISLMTQNLTSKNIVMENERNQLSIQPIIPGVNVPIEQLGHFFLALLLCTVFHEFGHAIAASAIYCAGVFHNMVLVLIALIFLLINPFIIQHLYIEAATVYRVSKDSPIYNLLPIHSTIQYIDGCNVNTSNDWYQCLRLIRDRHPEQSSGYCLTQAKIQLLSNHIEFNQTNNYDCCQNLFQKNYCFLYHSKQHIHQNGACMEARSVTNHPPCLLNSDCHRQRNDASCVHPFSIDNITRLIRIVHNQGPPILFVGSINEIYQTINIQSYQAKYKFISTILITDIPLFFQYVAAFSFALAFFNAVPCYALDGQYILLALIEYLSPSLYQRRHNRLNFSLIFGTCLLIINISLAFARYFL
ncbi:unnamed protein product [Rotaria sp. Silwood1]|nr:unnamed protein product [Rotaria sp. Silwood1]CAF3676194.1 unnamed protein product [Rotaria sp. Silwood1]CAF3705362.1 unnamed protein product [Rotaria sp. Silwood1]